MLQICIYILSLIINRWFEHYWLPDDNIFTQLFGACFSSSVINNKQYDGKYSGKLSICLLAWHIVINVCTHGKKECKLGGPPCSIINSMLWLHSSQSYMNMNLQRKTFEWIRTFWHFSSIFCTLSLRHGLSKSKIQYYFLHCF